MTKLRQLSSFMRFGVRRSNELGRGFPPIVRRSVSKYINGYQPTKPTPSLGDSVAFDLSTPSETMQAVGNTAGLSATAPTSQGNNVGRRDGGNGDSDVGKSRDTVKSNGIRGEVLDLAADLRNFRPGDRLDIPYELTVSESMQEFWQSAFHSQDRINTSRWVKRAILCVYLTSRNAILISNPNNSSCDFIVQQWNIADPFVDAWACKIGCCHSR
jgi:hypothetical protein